MTTRIYGVGGNAIPLGGLRVEQNVTFRCNAICTWCNKGVGLVKFPASESDMTVEQTKRAVDQLIEQKVKVFRWTFCGGEPVLNSDLQGMIDEVARLKTLRIGRVLTNDMPVTKVMRDRIELPRRFRWVPNPLDDPNDPFSGKNNPKGRFRGRVHKPFWISPADIGMRAEFKNCTVRGWCGIGLDSSGWSMCGKATMLGKLLGIDPTMKEGNIEQHVDTPIEGICKHCQYGLESKAQERQIFNRYKDGEFPDISQTFKMAFACHESQPLIQIGAY